MPTLVPDTVAVVLPPGSVDPHGSLRLAARTYRAGFAENGYRTVTVDLDRLTQSDIQLLASPQIALIFSDGGWINTVSADLGTEVRPLVEVLGKPTLLLVNDSPCSYWMEPILGRDRSNQITAVLDPDFLTLWGRWTERKGTGWVYVPACPPLNPTAVQPAGDPPVPLLVAATVWNPEQFRTLAISRSGDGVPLTLFDGIAETLLSDPLRSVSGACDEVSRTLGIELDYRDKDVRLLIFAADYYVRNRRRQWMLDRLSRHPITLVGGGEGIRMHPDSSVLPSVSHERLLELYGQARTVVVPPPYAGGISERVVHAMAAGSLVVAPPTALSDRVFGRDRLFVACAADFSDLDECLERARSPGTWNAMTAEASATVRRDFSAGATVRRLLDGSAVPAG